jgi:hypothetical protein
MGQFHGGLGHVALRICGNHGPTMYIYTTAQVDQELDSKLLHRIIVLHRIPVRVVIISRW